MLLVLYILHYTGKGKLIQSDNCVVQNIVALAKNDFGKGKFSMSQKFVEN